VKKKLRFTVVVALLASIWLVMGETAAAGTIKLRDYDNAVRSNNLPEIRFIRSYILGAVETHLMFSKMLKNWTSFNALCTGNDDLNIDELGAIFEMKIMALRRKYGEDIMGMPVVDVVPMIVEEHYRCF
jgi:hypothetical protein